MKKNQFFNWITFFIICNVCVAATANEIKCPIDRVIFKNQLSILEDPTQSLTIEQVNKPHFTQQFRPNRRAQTNFGISQSAIWFKIEPMMSAACSDDWLLAIRWPLVDNIDFYWHEKNQWNHISTGAKHPYASRQINFHTFMFRLPDLSKNHPAYFVRVVSDSPLFMGMRILQKARFTINAQRRTLLQGIYLGVVIGLILYNLFLFISLRDTAYLYYVIYLLSITLLVAQFTGISTRYLWPAAPEWNVLALWVFILTGTIAYLAFIGQFINTQLITPRLEKLRLSFIFVLLIALVALYFLENEIMISVIPFLALIGFSLSGISIFNAIKKDYHPAIFVGLSNIFLIAGMTWAIILMFGYPIKLSAWNYFIFLLGIVIEAILLSLALASKIKLLNEEKLFAQQRLLESKHRFSDQLIAAQDTERKRVASELHDGIGQNLIVVNNRLNRLLKTDLSPEFSKQLNFASSITQQTIHDLRGLSHLLHPHLLDRLGLSIAIKTMANETLHDTKIQLSCHIDVIDQLVNKDQSLHLYRVVQEAMNNIIYHSGANQVTISTTVDKQMLFLKVNDNGQGIDGRWFEQKDFSQAFGLSSIQERVQLMSGHFDIFNQPSTGLTLEIKIPLTPKES